MNLEADTLALAARSAGPDGDDFLHDILAEAQRRGAAKVHFEPMGRELRIRFRVSGALIEALRVPAVTGKVWLDRIDAGAIRIEGRTLAGVTLTTSEGRRGLLHIGAAEVAAEALQALGMRPSLVRALGAGSTRGGLVLVAGPQGSGCSTTLRALMRHLDDGARSFVSVDGMDDGAIAAAMDQDADVILAGAIADRRGAAAVVRAAEAGHLVLASLAARDSIGAILRLREWRVEPFQLASTLQTVLAQRLVRRLCPDCREPVQAQGSVSALLGFDPGAVVYAPIGCEACGHTGFAGQTGVFEAIHVDAALRRLINDGGDGAILARHAFVNAPNLGSAARALVREGVITPEEAVRISKG